VQYTVDPTFAAASGATILVVVVAVIILDLCIGLDLLSERK
jgi:putative spermidine/putrescine transport system permease protein